MKEAFRHDWEQTKHDFGGNAPDLNQDVDDTIGQATGAQPVPPGNRPAFDNDEYAYRFGYGARQHYDSSYPDWNDDLESRLRQGWEETGDTAERTRDTFKDKVRRGWDRMTS